MKKITWVLKKIAQVESVGQKSLRSGFELTHPQEKKLGKIIKKSYKIQMGGMLYHSCVKIENFKSDYNNTYKPPPDMIRLSN